MGAILAHRLQVRNDPLLTKYSRLQKGLMDKRLLHQLGMDITSVFQQTNVDVHKPALLHLSLDASGSMCGPKWHRVATVATALAYVSTKLRSIDAIITIRGGSEMPVVAVVFDSRSNSFLQCTKTLRLIGPGGATPEGLCFKATMDLILEHTKTHAVYFINFSDGEPSMDVKISGDPLKKVSRRSRRGGRWDDYMMYSGVVATRHTRETVQEMRNNGIHVLSYFISDYPNMEALREKSTAWSAFRTMYGEDAVLTNVEQATNVIRTLNKYLVIRD
jgi:hypothetical protein